MVLAIGESRGRAHVPGHPQPGHAADPVDRGVRSSGRCRNVHGGGVRCEERFGDLRTTDRGGGGSERSVPGTGCLGVPEPLARAHPHPDTRAHAFAYARAHVQPTPRRRRRPSLRRSRPRRSPGRAPAGSGERAAGRPAGGRRRRDPVHLESRACPGLDRRLLPMGAPRLLVHLLQLPRRVGDPVHGRGARDGEGTHLDRRRAGEDDRRLRAPLPVRRPAPVHRSGIRPPPPHGRSAREEAPGGHRPPGERGRAPMGREAPSRPEAGSRFLGQGRRPRRDRRGATS